jgi:hypothetical protein
MEMEGTVGLVRVGVEMIYPLGVDERRASLDAVHHIALLQEKLGQ